MSQDYWVVTNEMVTRVHVTPRCQLFTPEQTNFPISMEYIDVYRTTKANVSGFDNYVDCWVWDEDNPIPGSWVGKTMFEVRQPLPNLDGKFKEEG